MLAEARRAALALLALTLLTGVLYPLAVTGLAKVLFPQQAAGSLVEADGRTVGSTLLGQPFEDPRHFWGRLSATAPAPYNAGASAGSNLGPTNPALRAAAEARIRALRAADPGAESTAAIPVDLVTASASGLDPHISPAGALYQVRRVARARGIDEARVRALVLDHVEPPDLALFGDPRVNVVALNRALDSGR